MASHVQHHYVPKFLLQQWAGDDRKLASFRWEGSRLILSRNAPKAVAKAEHLYSTERGSGAPDVTLERDFFGPLLDDLAAPIHQLLLNAGVDALDVQQRTDWSRFLLAQMIRVPAAIEYMRRMGHAFMLENFRNMATHAGKPEMADIWLHPDRRDTLSDQGLRALRRVVESPQFNSDIIFGDWTILDIERGHFDALISDRPLTYLGNLKENAFLLALPLSPWKYFVCASTKEDIAKVRTNGGMRFIKSGNRHAVKQADSFVYAVDVHRHEPLVRKYLRRT